MARRIRAREVLRLRSVNGLSQNAIARTAHVSKHSVQDVLEAARERGVSWEDVEGMSEEAAYALLFPGRGDAGPVHADPDWARVHRELARTGVTLKLLHAEYADGCAEAGAPSMSYDRFCKRYRQYTVSRNVVSRVGHKAGRNMEVDWSGPTMRLVDPATGEVRKVYLFVACLPFSRYSYVEPTLDMKQDTWLLCHVHAFSFLGGATPCIVPDNLRTGVTAHPRAGEPVLNAAYEELAAHYGSAVIPARVRRPRDKPSAENEVWAAATYVIAALRDEVFTDMAALRAAVARRVAEHNDAPFAKREGSRREVFEEVERPLLRPLPAEPFEVCEWVYGRKVQANCHVAYARNYYSVSHLLVGSTVDLRVTEGKVEVFSGGERVATHPRFPSYARNRYSTRGSDMPEGRAWSDWDAPRIRAWASRVGPSCSELVDRVLLASIYFSPVSLNRRTVRAKAVSPVALTLFHRFRSRLDGAVPRQVLQPVGPAGYLDQVAVVAHPVRDRARRHVVPEHPAPAADPHVGGDDRRALLVARRYQLEQQVRSRAADVEVAELIDDQQPRVGVVLEPLLEDAARRGVLQVLDEPGAVHEPDLAPRPDGLDAQRDGEVRLAHAGAPHEQDVLGPLDEPQGRELLDLGARDRRLEVPVEVRQPLDVGEPRRPYALVGDPDLPGGDLDARHLLEGGGEAPLARGDHPHVVGQGRRHLVQPERGEVRLRPDRGAALRDGAHHAPPSESSSARLARAASAMSASARPRFPSRACP